MKTKRTKRNVSPRRPFGPRTNVGIVIGGDIIQTRGIRGRTVVKRITDEDGKRLKTARLVAPATQLPAPKDGAPIYVGRVYTGVPRGKAYYPSTPAADASLGFLGGLTRRVKQVIVGGV